MCVDIKVTDLTVLSREQQPGKKKIPEVILKFTLGSRVVGKMKIAGESDVFSGKPNPSPNFTHFSENLVEWELLLRGGMGEWTEKGLPRGVTFEPDHDGDESSMQRNTGGWEGQLTTKHVCSPRVMPTEGLHFPAFLARRFSHVTSFWPMEWKQERSVPLPGLLHKNLSICPSLFSTCCLDVGGSILVTLCNKLPPPQFLLKLELYL